MIVKIQCYAPQDEHYFFTELDDRDWLESVLLRGYPYLAG
jgi:hypothetical protein